MAKNQGIFARFAIIYSQKYAAKLPQQLAVQGFFEIVMGWAGYYLDTSRQ